LDYGFDEADFINALDSAWGDHVTFGITEFISNRVTSAFSQLDNNVPTPNLVYQVSSKVFDGQIELSFKSTANSANVGYRIEGTSNWNLLSPEIVGTTIWDNTMRVILPLAGFQGTIEWQVVPLSQNMVANPCQIFVTHVGLDSLGYWINEIAPSGTLGFTDELGEQGDWIEIYRGSSAPFMWNDIWITDNPHDPNKWKLKQIQSNAPSFLTFWADDSPQQGNRHLNFKLSSNGEFVGISHWDNGDFHWLDSISFPAITVQQSFARVVDGGTPWEITTSVTPAASNMSTSISEQTIDLLHISPNPANDFFYWPGGYGQVYNIQGDLCLVLNGSERVSTNQWSSGVYSIVSERGVQRMIILH
jgi:hypothetical protein